MSAAYEELQILLSQSKRSISNGEVLQGIENAVTGGVRLIGKGHPECGVELGLHIIKSVGEEEVGVNRYDSVKQALLKLDDAMRSSRADLTHRARMLKAAVKWSVAKGPRFNGDRDLNRIYGEVLLEEGKTPLDRCIDRLVAAEEPNLITHHVLGIFASKAEREERDHMLAYAMLSFLSLQNFRDANGVMDEYLERGEGWKPTDPPTVSPLLSFCSALLATCERDAGQLFQYLCKAYEGYLSDTALQQRLAVIGDKFFGIKPPPSMMDMLGQMMGMFGS